MQLHPQVWRQFIRPTWFLIVVVAVVVAAGGGLWLGLQQDQGETSTTFVFGSRIGFDAPLVDLEDHIADIVNSVEFGPVFARIESRVQLEAEKDYTLEIGILEDTQSVVSIEVQTERAGQADRISRIVAEEMVRFVLEGVDETIATNLEEVERDLAILTAEQTELIQQAGGVTPVQAELSIDRQIAELRTEAVTPNEALEGELLADLVLLQPLADTFRENQVLVDTLEAESAAIQIQQTEIEAATQSVSSLWYRSVSPPEETSKLPVAIAMAFAAAVPALIAATVLVVLNINRRLVNIARAERRSNDPHVAAA